tara:strand:+ start:16929 stop:17144 length:216 start_codon:yes stop_codon:yes gene_type:complete
MNNKVKPEEAIDFLESFRLLQEDIDKPAKAISIRVPENIIDLFKTLAKTKNSKYQSLMVEAMRDYIKRQKQ